MRREYDVNEDRDPDGGCHGDNKDPDDDCHGDSNVNKRRE